MAKKKIEAEVVALGSSNSDLTKATALEAKISKADMTNIIQQEVNESIYKAIKDLEGTLALIKIEEGALLKEVEKKILSIYINAAKETYPNINIKEEWRNMDWLNLDKILPEYHKERLAICQGCPELIKLTSQCKKCGCIMSIKTKLEAAKCPIGKW
jgi:hypothetical protein